MRKQFKNLFLLYTFISLASIGYSQGVRSAHAETNVKFTVNKNQWDKKILYRAQLDGGVLFLQSNCFTYNFYDKETLHDNHVSNNTKNLSTRNKEIRSHAFRMNLPILQKL